MAMDVPVIVGIFMNQHRLRVRQGEELFINALSARERESLQRHHSDMTGDLGPA